MSRGMSTVVDVALATVLIGASVAVFVGAPPPAGGGDATPIMPDSGGVAVAGATLTVSYRRADGERATVTGTVAGLLRDAAIARRRGTGRRYVDAVRRRIDRRIDRVGTPAQLVGACGMAEPVVAGPTPPGDAPVIATVYRWNRTAANGTDCRPVVVVRRWSP